MGVKIVQIRWMVVTILRPPLTADVIRMWACPFAVTVSDESFWWGGQ